MTIRKKQADSQVSMGKEQSHRLQFVEIMRRHALLNPFHQTALIIRKTKRFAISERAVYFLKTKRTAGGSPPPQNIFDRLTPVFT